MMCACHVCILTCCSPAALFRGLSYGSCLHAAVLYTITDISCCRCAAFVGLEYDNPDRPEAANLLAIYSLVTGKSTVSIPCLLGILWPIFKKRTLCQVTGHT